MATQDLQFDFTLVVGVIDSASYGNRFEGTTDSDGIVTAGFAGTDTDLTLSFQGWDIDFDDELELFLNGDSLGFLNAGLNEDFVSYQVAIPADIQIDGTNVLTFKQQGKVKWKWGVTDLLLSEGAPPPPPPVETDIVLVLGNLETGNFGNRFFGETDSDGILTAGFAGTDTDLMLSFRGWDIDFDDELELFLNGDSLGFLNAGLNEDFADYQVAIPADIQIDGTNVLTFKQQGKVKWKWGVTDLLLEIGGSEPATPTMSLAASSDTGVSSSDGITADASPSFFGTAGPDAVVEVFRGGVSLGTTTADAAGNWSFTAAGLDDGAHYFTAVSDHAGSPVASDVLEVIVDTVAPGAASVSAFADDTGTPGDGITSDTTLAISGYAEAGTRVSVFANGTFLGDVQATGTAIRFDAATYVPPALAPAAIKGSPLNFLVEEVGQVASADTQNNFAAPVVIGSSLFVVDQRGTIYRQTGSTFEAVFDATAQAPDELSPIGKEAILNICEGPGGSVYVAFTSSTLPEGGFPFHALPDSSAETGGTDLYAAPERYVVTYRYDVDPDTGAFTNPRPLAAFEQTGGHSGGGMLTLPNGDLLLARGDNLRFDRDGLSAPQDPGETISKLLIVDQETGEVTVAALGVRNVQRLTYTDDAQTHVAFADIGAATAEEINVVSIADLVDTTLIENFGWGRRAGDDSDGDGSDGSAREGTFFVDDGATSNPGTTATAIGEAPTPEAGFVQPYAQFGREDLAKIAVAGPVFSPSSFIDINALFVDFISGKVLAATAPVGTTLNDVFEVSLVDAFGDTFDFFGYSPSQTRLDARVFAFPDGDAGILLEGAGTLFKLTEQNHDLSGTWTYATPPLEAGTHRITAVAEDAAGNLSNVSDMLEITIVQGDQLL